MQTLRLVLFHPSRLALEMTRPAHFRDAQQFRRAVLFIALVPFATCVTIDAYSIVSAYWWQAPDNLVHHVRGYEPVFGAGAIALLWICLAALFFSMTGVITYWFHPRELSTLKQNRAIAISYYTCAAFALTPITLLAPIAANRLLPMLVRALPDANLPNWLAILSWFPVIAQLVLIVVQPIFVVGIVTGSNAARVKLAVTQLIAWPLLAVGCLIVIPIVCITLTLMLLSLAG